MDVFEGDLNAYDLWEIDWVAHMWDVRSSRQVGRCEGMRSEFGWLASWPCISKQECWDGISHCLLSLYLIPWRLLTMRRQRPWIGSETEQQDKLNQSSDWSFNVLVGWKKSECISTVLMQIPVPFPLYWRLDSQCLVEALTAKYWGEIALEEEWFLLCLYSTSVFPQQVPKAIKDQLMQLALVLQKSGARTYCSRF